MNGTVARTKTKTKCYIMTGFYMDKILSRSLCGVHLCELQLCFVTVKYCRQACVRLRFRLENEHHADMAQEYILSLLRTICWSD